MSQNALDLSNLPEEIRGRVEMALMKLPPDQRQQFLKHGSPLLNRMINKIEQSAGTRPGAGQHTGRGGPPPLPSRIETPTRGETPSRPVTIARQAPSGHYNQTIQPGDRAGFGLLWVVLPVVVALGWLWLR
ncbi:hypothetical protein [Arenimonas sp. MALMAid1274]|uniref:hypothetical protein n=1 Tax=Arenimonas sp. MALMAid1274 TaxID=3411630 RepID=UPI003BA2F7E2